VIEDLHRSDRYGKTPATKAVFLFSATSNLCAADDFASPYAPNASVITEWYLSIHSGIQG